MTREAIMSVVTKHLAHAVEGLNASTIEGTRTMKDYGANSLDIVEVVSASMRELKIKVPRSELNKLKDINGLVDLLSATAQRAPATASPAAVSVPQ